MTCGRTRAARTFKVLFFSFLLALPFLGCLDSPDSLTDIPRVTIYRPDDHTKIFVTGQNADTLYDSINITIENTTDFKEQVYSLEMETPSQSFELAIEVLWEEKIYHFKGHLELEGETEDDKTSWKMTYINRLDENKTTEETLPYKELLEKL